MASYISIIILVLSISFSSNILESNFSFIYQGINDDKNPKYNDLKEWLNKLVINLPNDLIKEETQGLIENLTLYGISLDEINTTSPKVIDNKVGVTISLKNISINIKGIFIFFSSPINFIANISKLSVELPFFLVRDPETGLISEVETSGFNIDLDNMEIELELNIADLLRDIVISVLKEVLKLIKASVIEKNLVEIMNMKFEELFQKANNIILILE